LSIDKLVDLLKKTSGIRWYALISKEKGELISRSPTLTDDKINIVVKTSTLSNQLISEVENLTLVSTTGSYTRSLTVKHGVETIDIIDLGENTLILSIDEKIHDTLINVLNKYRSGETFKCKVCGYDLTLETYSCPRCGRTIPFIIDRCPFCNYDLYAKLCPNHKGYVNTRGEPLKRDITTLAVSLFIALIIIVFTILISPFFAGYQIIFYGLGGIVSALVALLGYMASTPR